MKVYSKPKSNQRQEKLFQEYLMKGFPALQHINETYTLSESEFLNPFIDIRKIEKLLEKDSFLSNKKKISVLKIISKLPDSLRVAESNNKISVDFLIIDKNKRKQYFEFHEKQHRGLTGSRLRPIYDKEFNRFDIPRFVQRFLKDTWRYENLPNFKIVWFDWFAANPNYNTLDLIKSDKNEFANEGKFTFSKLFEKNIK